LEEDDESETEEGRGEGEAEAVEGVDFALTSAEVGRGG
jgi:hypothetical protein